MRRLPRLRPRPLAALLAALAAACADAAAPAGGGPGRAPDPTPYSPDIPEADPTPPLTPAELGAGLDAALLYLHRLDPLIHHDLWTAEFWGHADGVCPALQEHNGMDYWNDRCTAADGTTYTGWTLNFRGQGWQESPGTWMADFAWLSGHAVLVMPDGTELSNFGDVMYQHVEESGGTLGWQGFVFGDFRYTGAAGAGTWVQAETTNVTDYRYSYLPGGVRSAWFDAELAWFAGPVAAVRLEDTLFTEEASGCPAEPTGRVRLRDEAGRWYELVFDETCDGCGEAWLDDQDLGEVCIDATPLFDWPEERWPWGP